MSISEMCRVQRVDILAIPEIRTNPFLNARNRCYLIRLITPIIQSLVGGLEEQS